MLKIENLSKSYFIKNKEILACKNINLNINDGSFIWIKGNSGAGKSTLLNIIAGIDKPDSGNLLWNEKSLITIKKNESCDFRIHTCGLVFQFFELLKTQSVYKNVCLPMIISKKSKNEIKERMDFLLNEFEIFDLKNKKPNELSGGEKQRVAICRALSNFPKLLLLDEITASLDTELSHKTYTFLKKYIQENNSVGIFVSHDEIINNYADEIYSMRAGELKKCI